MHSFFQSFPHKEGELEAELGTWFSDPRLAHKVQSCMP